MCANFCLLKHFHCEILHIAKALAMSSAVWAGPRAQLHRAPARASKHRSALAHTIRAIAQGLVMFSAVLAAPPPLALLV